MTMVGRNIAKAYAAPDGAENASRGMSYPVGPCPDRAKMEKRVAHYKIVRRGDPVAPQKAALAYLICFTAICIPQHHGFLRT
jgi:hypothetical protein